MHEPLAWVTEDEKFDSILAIGKDAIFVAMASKGDLFNAQDMIRTGSDPKRVLPREYAEFGQEELLEIRHLRGSKYITIRYVDEKDKPRKDSYYFADSENAAQAVRAIAKAMKLSVVPREEKATIAAITWAPLVAAASAIALPLGSLRRIAAPAVMAAVMAIAVVAAIGYWAYRLVNRPIVDVYTAVIP